ncbi:hypothetical protein BZA70DRAFT_266856 [Myxozyma melibiosi]|uniref:CID domain-containing protein n=1 Tax=Myxozyma melibiosi TaxID=54550 RepID=A0ABR1F7B2_9ASCO
MSSEVITEFESLLASMLELRPPGVSGSKIRRLSEIAMQNVQSESVLIQKLYAHCKKAAPNYKLGALYVVDAIVRGYYDEARKLETEPSASSPEGTPAAAVYHISDVIDSLIVDSTSAPADQKDKIVKLIDIWERASTFSPQLLETLRSHFSKSSSTTPPRPPPAYLVGAGNGSAPASSAAAPPSAPAPSTSSILEALSSISKPSSSAPAPAPEKPAGTPSLQDIISSATGNTSHPPPAPAPAPKLDLASLLSSATQGAIPPAPATSSAPPAPAAPDMASLLPLLSGQQQQQQFQQPPMSIPGFPAFQAPQPQAPTGGVEQQVALMQLLLAQGVPLAQVASILQAAGGAMQMAQPPVSSTPSWPPMNSDRRERDRSRSPRGRRSPEYRSRSPRGYRSASPPGRTYPRAPVEKRPRNVSTDPSVPRGCIRVLSRTLFVGGVPVHMSEEKLISIFEQCCPVQSVIMNKDKRCAFLKVYYRSDAEIIKRTMETYSEDDYTLRCRWGVGFGPRDCCEYATGVSTIPIDRLTDADKRWVTTAEYGGTGGQRLEEGLVIEEPDIEIGAGVSSKAISRRMPTNQGGDMGPKSSAPDSFGARGGVRRGRRR